MPRKNRRRSKKGKVEIVGNPKVERRIVKAIELLSRLIPAMRVAEALVEEFKVGRPTAQRDVADANARIRDLAQMDSRLVLAECTATANAIIRGAFQRTIHVPKVGQVPDPDYRAAAMANQQKAKLFGVIKSAEVKIVNAQLNAPGPIPPLIAGLDPKRLKALIQGKDE